MQHNLIIYSARRLMYYCRAETIRGQARLNFYSSIHSKNLTGRSTTSRDQKSLSKSVDCDAASNSGSCTVSR
eukprot:gene23661-9860_t